MKLGLFGRPVSHSSSPKLFAALGRILNRKIEYEAVRVDGPLSAAVEAARAKGWRGASVTIPFKLEAADLAGGLTSQARAVGAVNVLRFESKLVGHNTDADGLADALRGAGIAVKDRVVMIFGARGAAAAAGWACGKEGARAVRFVNRTAPTARRLARALAKSFPKTRYSAGAAANADVWINATPLGQGDNDESPAPAGLKAPRAAVDLVYGKVTPFQRRASEAGAKVIDGTAMLVHQALRAWEFWDKPLTPARRAEIAEELIEELS
ncbi:MAG: shikimate dehydrogenase [Elusimicrobia bacterium]|nr:shikimate dehydrogenase [Elusimicrobiota bacterium]